MTTECGSHSVVIIHANGERPQWSLPIQGASDDYLSAEVADYIAAARCIGCVPVYRAFGDDCAVGRLHYHRYLVAGEACAGAVEMVDDHAGDVHRVAAMPDYTDRSRVVATCFIDNRNVDGFRCGGRVLDGQPL